MNSLKNLLGCVVAGVGLGGVAWWIAKIRSEESTFRELLRGLTVGPNPEEVLHQIAARAAKLVGGTAAYVERIDPEHDEIVVAAVHNGHDVPATGMRGPYAGSVAEQVIQTGQPAIIKDVALESRSILASLKQHSPAVVLPLTTDHSPMGALIVLQGRTRFTSRTIDRLQVMAHMSAVSLRRAATLEKLEHSLRAREELQRVLAHDLRNPINTITIAAKALTQSRDLDEKDTRLLEMIQRSTLRMNRLIQDLIDNVVIERRGELPLNPQEHASQSLAEEVCELIRMQAQAKTVHVDCEFEGNLTVRVDRDRFLQVLVNIIDNAIKFTPKGGTVTLKSEVDNDEVRFSVSDSGPGIPEADHHRVFEPYWQAPGTAHLGAGLGLAIAKQIVKQHGGRIWVESAEGQGSTFVFTIPASHN